MTAHTLVDRQPDVDAVLKDIKALPLDGIFDRWNGYDITHIPYYFNDWWKENIANCQLSGMVPKSSVRDVMELVDDHFSLLVSAPDLHLNAIFHKTCDSLFM